MAKATTRRENSPVAQSPVSKRPESRPMFQKSEDMVFGKETFKWLLGGIALIAVGLVMMVGGEQTNPNEWNPNEIYSTRITVVAPILMLAGFTVVAFSLFRKSDSK